MAAVVGCGTAQPVGTVAQPKPSTTEAASAPDASDHVGETTSTVDAQVSAAQQDASSSDAGRHVFGPLTPSPTMSPRVGTTAQMPDNNQPDKKK